MKMSLPGKAGYGVASVGLSAIELMLQVYLLDLYILAGLSPASAGLAIALAVIWDAVSDPLMGAVMDNTAAKTLAGKRVPFMVAGSVLICFSFALLFSPPVGDSEEALFNYLLLSYLMVNTATTLFGVPYLSLINDLAGSERERASLFSWKIVFGSVGLLVGIGIPAYLAMGGPLDSVSSTLAARESSGLFLGALAALGCLATALRAFKGLKAQFAQTASSGDRLGLVGICKVFRYGMKAPFFVYLVIGFIAIAVSRSLNSSLAIPYYKSTLGYGEREIGWVLLLLTVMIILAAPAWVWVSGFKRKQFLFVSAALTLAGISAVVYPAIPSGVIYPALIVSVVGGGLVASIVLLDSLFSDFVELEKRAHGMDVSGLYYGVWRMLSKIARAIGIGFSGFFLAWIGYESGTTDQEESVERSIAWAFGPGVSVFLIIGSILIKRSEKYEEFRAAQSQ
ncbi:MAG: MFS transporter [Verrucomicrobiota bacterium]